MAEPTKADLAGALDDRLRKVETVLAEKVGKLAILAWMAGLGVPVLAVAVGWLFSTVASEREASAVAAAQIARQSEELKEIRAKHERLSDSYHSIRQSIAVLYDRQEKPAVKVPEALVYNGEIKRVVDNELWLLPFDEGLPLIRFPLAASVPLSRGGKSIKLTDVKPGMKADVVTAGGEIVNVLIR
jgi:hypothetical protein